MEIREMTPDDWPAVRDVYAEGIAGRGATFETRTPPWDAFDEAHLDVGRLVAVEDGRVVGWAALSPFSRRPVYAGVAEVSVYVANVAQGRGVGRALVEAVIAASERAGIWTLQAGVFPENGRSLRLFRALGFREIGVQERPARLDGVWRDVVLLERRSTTVGVDGGPADGTPG